MSLVRRKDLPYCFETKLSGEMTRTDGHIFYDFRVNGRVVVTTHISPSLKYRDFGDDILSKISRQLHITLGRLKRSAKCDQKATRQILEHWASLLPG